MSSIGNGWLPSPIPNSSIGSDEDTLSDGFTVHKVILTDRDFERDKVTDIGRYIMKRIAQKSQKLKEEGFKIVDVNFKTQNDGFEDEIVLIFYLDKEI